MDLHTCLYLLKMEVHMSMEVYNNVETGIFKSLYLQVTTEFGDTVKTLAKMTTQGTDIQRMDNGRTWNL